MWSVVDIDFFYQNAAREAEEEENGVQRPMTDDQKKVFDFFNEGTPQELAAIQGCSKKKVESILELRPYLSWQDLVKKCQMSRQLNTEMLNNTTDLLKMRDGISR